MVFIMLEKQKIFKELKLGRKENELPEINNNYFIYSNDIINLN